MNDPKRILVVLLGLIVLVMCFLGIKGHMDSDGYKTQVRYTTAIQTTTANDFNYSVDTQQGNLLTNGKFATDTKNLVKFPEMTKAYSYVDRTKEHYTAHTTCSKRSCSTYYTWDETAEDYQKTPHIGFDGRQYAGTTFNFSKMIQHQNCAGITNATASTKFFSNKHGCDGTNYYLDNDDRYTYSIVPQTFTATFLASSAGGGLHGSGEQEITLQNKSVKQALVDVGKYQLVAFWVVTVLIILAAIGAGVGAYYWVMEDGMWSTQR